jgi:hypothetical protein
VQLAATQIAQFVHVDQQRSAAPQMVVLSLADDGRTPLKRPDQLAERATVIRCWRCRNRAMLPARFTRRSAAIASPKKLVFVARLFGALHRRRLGHRLILLGDIGKAAGVFAHLPLGYLLSCAG